MIIHHVIQGSPEWNKLRLGKMTASHAQCIATGGKGLETYCRLLAAEIFTGMTAENYTNQNMIIGLEEERYARIAYEMQTGHDVAEVGFVEFSEYVGASPDGLVGDRGGVEIKRKTFTKHNDLLLGAEMFEEKYVWQCYMNLLVTGRLWWDLVSYNPCFKGQCLFQVTFQRDPIREEQLLEGFDKGQRLIIQNLEKLNG